MFNILIIATSVEIDRKTGRERKWRRRLIFAWDREWWRWYEYLTCCASFDGQVYLTFAYLKLKYSSAFHRLNKGKTRSSEEEVEPTCTKIYYASRTHSQLTQIIPELRKLKLSPMPSNNLSNTNHDSSSLRKRDLSDQDDDAEEDILRNYTRTVSLGSRKQLCVNDELKAKSGDIDESCRELLGSEFHWIYHIHTLLIHHREEWQKMSIFTAERRRWAYGWLPRSDIGTVNGFYHTTQIWRYTLGIS